MTLPKRAIAPAQVLSSPVSRNSPAIKYARAHTIRRDAGGVANAPTPLPHLHVTVTRSPSAASPNPYARQEHPDASGKKVSVVHFKKDAQFPPRGSAHAAFDFGSVLQWIGEPQEGGEGKGMPEKSMEASSDGHELGAIAQERGAETDDRPLLERQSDKQMKDWNETMPAGKGSSSGGSWRASRGSGRERRAGRRRSEEGWWEGG